MRSGSLICCLGLALQYFEIHVGWATSGVMTLKKQIYSVLGSSVLLAVVLGFGTSMHGWGGSKRAPQSALNTPDEHAFNL